MTSPLQKILESKITLRRDLASRSVAEKLQILDAMREREIGLRSTERSPRSPAYVLTHVVKQ